MKKEGIVFIEKEIGGKLGEGNMYPENPLIVLNREFYKFIVLTISEVLNQKQHNY